MNLRNWIASLGVLAGLSGPAQADWPGLNLNFRMNFGGHNGSHGGVITPELAPWYSYFPQDPNQGTLGQHQSPYPTWPTQYPPSEPSADAVARQWMQHQAYQQAMHQQTLQQQAMQQQALQQRMMQQYGQPVSYPRPPLVQSIPNYRR